MKKIILFLLFTMPVIANACIVNKDGSHECWNQPKATDSFTTINISNLKEKNFLIKINNDLSDILKNQNISCKNKKIEINVKYEEMIMLYPKWENYKLQIKNPETGNIELIFDINEINNKVCN